MPSFDPYEDDLEQFHPSVYDGKARRRPRERRRRRSVEVAAERAEVADSRGVREGRGTTYRPAVFERGWLQSSLIDFFEQELLADILAKIKGGKEATVYRCAGGPAAPHPLIAAKVYRPRQFRNLANDQLYRAGRPVLTADGREVTKHDERVLRALHRRTAFGAQVRHTSWLMHEFTTLQTLWEAGADVPEPIAASDNAILMGYWGDDDGAAPLLQAVQLASNEAQRLFRRVMENVELLLQWGVVHGDLSAYNVLYWEGEIAIIDLPQVVHPGENDAAFAIFSRDVRRICEYFATQGIDADPARLAEGFWSAHVAEVRPRDREADLSRQWEETTE